MQWGADASTHLAATNSTSSFDFYTLAVNAAGVTVSHDFPNVFTSPVKRIHFEPSKNLVYADNGQIVKPTTGTSTGRFLTPLFFESALMVTDVAVNRAYFITQQFSSGAVTMQSFNLTTLAAIDSLTINNVNGNVGRLVRWARMALHSTLQEARSSLWLERLYTDAGGRLSKNCNRIGCPLLPDVPYFLLSRTRIAAIADVAIA